MHNDTPVSCTWPYRDGENSASWLAYVLNSIEHMKVARLIESVDLSVADLRTYLLSEIDEFVAADEPSLMEEEFGDVLFALMAMAWAHARRHFKLELGDTEQKLLGRLRRFGTLSRKTHHCSDERIPEMPVGVIHFAFGQFVGQWHRFDALKNGTVAEITALTDTEFGEPGRLTNHCIMTFDEVDQITYEIIYSSSSQLAGNTIRCRVPDFLYRDAKKGLIFGQLSELMALQVMAALDGLRLAPGAVAHFHSWESGFLAESAEFWRRISTLKTVFSPYLTTGRLKAIVDARGGAGWTMTPEELAVAVEYERKLSESCMRVVLESSLDKEFFERWVHPERLDLRSFAEQRRASYSVPAPKDGKLTFITGGRPVREKGFVELCREFARVRHWARKRGIDASLAILCRERKPGKGADYIREIENAIAAEELSDSVTIEPKVPLEELRHRIANASALVVPSLYDPYCLMPNYAVEARRPAFVSRHAGIAENIKSAEFTFDPEVEGDFLRAVRAWYEKPRTFHFESRFASYLGLYLSREKRAAWE